MNRVCWRMTEFVCQVLKVEEQEAVLGDLAESGQSAAQVFWEAACFAVRRQLALWRDWRPWVALLAVAGVAAVPLSQLTFAASNFLGQQIRTYRHYGVRFETGLTLGQDVAYLTCLCAALFLWSWVNGFVLGSLSGRTIWLNGAVFYFVVLDAFRTSLLLSGNPKILPWWPLSWTVLWLLVPFNLQAAVVLFTAVWGMRQGLKLRTVVLSRALFLTATISVLIALILWMEGWYQEVGNSYSAGAWHGPSWVVRLPPFLLATWPVCYLLGTSVRHSEERKYDLP